MSRAGTRLGVGDALAYVYGVLCLVVVVGVVSAFIVVGDTIARVIGAVVLLGVAYLARHAVRGLINERRNPPPPPPETPWGTPYEPSENPLRDIQKAAKKRDVPFLVSALRSSDPRIVRSAIRRLRRIGDPRAGEPLLEQLRVRDNSHRILVVQALARIGDAGAIPAIAEIANSGTVNWSVRLNAARALGDLGDRRGIALLAETLATPGGVNAELGGIHYKVSRRWAARTLIAQRGYEALPVLEKSSPGEGFRQRRRLRRVIKRLRVAQTRSNGSKARS